jgi:hypothetical protein
MRHSSSSGRVQERLQCVLCFASLVLLACGESWTVPFSRSRQGEGAAVGGSGKEVPRNMATHVVNMPFSEEEPVSQLETDAEDQVSSTVRSVAGCAQAVSLAATGSAPCDGSAQAGAMGKERWSKSQAET